MTDDATWYLTCESSTLMQGDIVPGCEVQKWDIEDVAEGLIRTTTVETDAIVLTQSCDLGNDGKTEFVLLAEIIDYDELSRINAKARKKDWRDNVAKGRASKLLLMPPHAGPPALPWSIVDFSRLYTIPKSVIEARAAKCGPRLRLRSPYREHLSQAFAVYFMRVGLPRQLDTFKEYEPSLERTSKGESETLSVGEVDPVAAALAPSAEPASTVEPAPAADTTAAADTTTAAEPAPATEAAPANETTPAAKPAPATEPEEPK